MRFFSITLFILFNIYLIESANRTESENPERGFESENSENVPEGAEEKSDKIEDVIYEDYEYDDRENSISGKSGKTRENTTESDGFPNEVFLSLRNITADAATAFRSFTNRNDVVDLQASASDNLNVSTNSSFGDAETAGINLRALRDAGHPPQIIEESVPLHLPYKHTKIDTADLSDCALQGEWKPMGVAHGHLHVGDGDNSHQTEILQSVGSYAVPNKVIPHWQQNLAGSQDLQDGGFNSKPLGLYSGGNSGSVYGYAPGFGDNGNAGVHPAPNHHYGGFSSLGHQKIKSASMLSPPPMPPIILGKKPGYWKLPKTKHKFFPAKGRRPGYGFSSQMNYGGSGFLNHAGGSGHLGHGGGGVLISGGSGHGIGGSLGHSIGGGSGHGSGGGSGHSIGGGLGHNIGGGSGHSIGGSLGHGIGIGGSSGHSIAGSLGHNIGGGSGHIIGGGSGHGSGGGSGHSIGGGLGHSIGGGSGYGTGGGSGYSVGVGSDVLGHLKGGGGSSHGGYSFGGSSGVSGHGFGGDGGSLSISDHGSGGGASAGHLIASHGIEEDLASGSHVGSSGYGSSSGGNLGGADGQSGVVVHTSGGGISGGHIVTINHAGGDTLLPQAAFLTTGLHKPSGGSHYPDSTFSSTHISQGVGGGNSLPDASFLSSHINQDFAVHGQGISDDLSSSSTFTCGKNHDHNTNYHTATFQVADHDHPSSVDVLQYGGDAAVLIQSGDASFHDQVLPERKHYKAVHLSDAEASGSDNANELTSQAAQLTQPAEPETVQTEPEAAKTDDGEEPERHSYYHEITKVTKIPATSVGSVEYTFSKYETKPQTFSTESETPQEEPEVEQPQIIRELEHLSNKFQLDVENPQKLFEDPPTQELAYHYPFQDGEHHQEGPESGKEEGVTEFPYKFYHNPNQITQYPVVINKKPVVKYIPRPGKPQFYQKTSVNYHQPKPLVVLRKHKPKQFLSKKQNYEVHEHGGERHRPVGEIFPPQKFPKQFHNPKPNFAVDRPKNGWRPDVYQEYKYVDHSHGKKVKKFKTKGKLVAPILIRRPVSPAPIIRVVEVSG